MPVYGLGTWNMGGGWDEPNSTNDQAEVAAIQAALQRGITHIDTAELYGGGHCEELVGEAIRGFDRSKLIITTKVLQGMAGGYDGVLRAAETSARRLGVDYLDLYLLHRYPRGKVAEVVSALDHLVEQGLVKNIGICNVTAESFEDVQRHSANKLVCDQVDYSLQVREAERRGVLEYCQKNDIFLIAWGPSIRACLNRVACCKNWPPSTAKRLIRSLSTG